MSDYDRDRGAYSPPGEPPLAFDARQQSSRGAGRPPTTLIISAAILLVLVVALIFYYRSGVRRSGEPPVVGAPLNEIKQPAPASSQPSPDAAAGLQVYKAEETPGAAPSGKLPAPTFAPEPEQPAPRPAPSPTHPVTAAPIAPPTATAPPAAAPTVAPAARPAPPVRPAIAPAPPSPSAAVAPAGGGAVVQIGAFSSPSQADKGWNDVARLMPGDMIGRTKRVEPVVKDDKTLYRAYVGGFGSRSEAASFCTSLKAAGRDCAVK